MECNTKMTRNVPTLKPFAGHQSPLFLFLRHLSTFSFDLLIRLTKLIEHLLGGGDKLLALLRKKPKRKFLTIHILKLLLSGFVLKLQRAPSYQVRHLDHVSRSQFFFHESSSENISGGLLGNRTFSAGECAQETLKM